MIPSEPEQQSVRSAITDEMVEQAARALHEVSDDVLPFDLPSPRGLKRRHERRERYLTIARAALEAEMLDDAIKKEK